MNGKTVVGKIGATVSHTMFLTGGLDDESRCEVGIVTLPDSRVLNGHVAQGLYEITLREELARLNELGGVGIRCDGLPSDDCQAVSRHDEGVCEPDQHI
jgi:hypothetical protein